MDNKELYHYGVMGQKWGVRRYQNKDGSLTPAGKKRYNQEADAGHYDREGYNGTRYKTSKEGKKEALYADPKRWAREDMKMGVGRYQNKDGSLTPAGQKRYDRDIRENNAKKKENRIIIDGPDSNRWVREDMSRAKKTIDSTSGLVKEFKNIERESRPTATKKKMDLSKMSDQELRDRINRANLEKQYNDLFGEPAKVTVSKGRKFAQNCLEVGGSVLAIGSSALGIALAIKELRS